MNKLLFPPQTEWIIPETFPDLSQAKEIAIDLETSDPNMDSMGPGWPVKNGFIVGFAFAVSDWKGYFPIKHQGGGNLDEKIVRNFVQDVLKTNSTKIFHNAAYDVGWLIAEGFTINGQIIDTLIAAPLLDENRFSYTLNSLGYDYLRETKSEKGLKEAAAAFGVHPKKELWKLPSLYVGSYAEQDAALTLKLWEYFKVELSKEEVTSIFEIETELLPVLIEITKKGVRFDCGKCQSLIKELQQEEFKLEEQIKELSGSPVDIWASASIAKAFDTLKIKYPNTETGLPSFTKNFLETHDHPLAKLIFDCREINKTHSTFLNPYIKFSEHDGRIHPHINQLRSDSGGTVTGRLSMANPNLQQVPARNPKIGKMVRGLFLPNEGEQWASLDFSSQEPRILVYYATELGLEGADLMKQAYEKNNNTDFHQMVADMAKIDRKTAKTIGLGLMYGMGKTKLAHELDLDLEEATQIIDKFHQQVPFLKGTIERVMRHIDKPRSKGAIRTLLGRKCRFDLWEPMNWGIHKALPHAEALAEHGPRIKRAYTYKGLNRLIQGSAADQTKAAMVALHKAGFNILLQIHDEIALSVKNRDEAQEASKIMNDAVKEKLTVPVKTDIEIGQSWGNAS